MTKRIDHTDEYVTPQYEKRSVTTWVSAEGAVHTPINSVLSALRRRYDVPDWATHRVRRAADGGFDVRLQWTVAPPLLQPVFVRS